MPASSNAIRRCLLALAIAVLVGALTVLAALHIAGTL